MKKMIKIANAQAFWGDSVEAASKLLEKQIDLDYITLDYLSEVSLSIMAVQRAKEPEAGYAKDFIEVVKSLVPFWKQGSKVKVITNAGGLSPKQCAEACVKALKELNSPHLKIAVVYGDDVADLIHNHSLNPLWNHLESNESISAILDRLTTANAYLGSKPIVEALTLGADLIITGRVADPSLTVAPCVAHFGWSWDDYDKIAQATVAGHLIECGTQVTGGISTNWLEIPDVNEIGFPFVEIDHDANVIVTKPQNTGGKVTLDIVKEQLVYEIGDPHAYLSPDAIVSFLSLKLEQIGKDRVLVVGAKGRAPPVTYKVSATYRDGYKAEGMLAIVGKDSEKKARRAGEVIFSKMEQAQLTPENFLAERLGCGEIVPGIHSFNHHQGMKNDSFECILRVCVADSRREVLEYFVKQLAPLVTCGPPGTTGYTTGRPPIRPVFGYWPCLIETALVFPKIEWFEVS